MLTDAQRDRWNAAVSEWHRTHCAKFRPSKYGPALSLLNPCRALTGIFAGSQCMCAELKNHEGEHICGHCHQAFGLTEPAEGEER